MFGFSSLSLSKSALSSILASVSVSVSVDIYESLLWSNLDLLVVAVVMGCSGLRVLF